ncbi:MAG TPA: hypothetical protein PJ990_16880 [Saprospiraceae bacterium]|nr:hypothetical protein [Saprospiraceae bacterium]
MTPAALFIGNLVDSKGYKFLTLSDIDLLLVNKTKYNYDHVVLTYDVKDKLKYKRDLSKYKYYVDSLRPTYINFIVPIKNTREQEIIRNYLESNVVNLYTEEELSRYNITNKIVLNANKNIQSPEFIKKFTRLWGRAYYTKYSLGNYNHFSIP